MEAFQTPRPFVVVVTRTVEVGAFVVVETAVEGLEVEVVGFVVAVVVEAMNLRRRVLSAVERGQREATKRTSRWQY